MVKDSQYGGVPQGQEGLILQRGGEELLLEKVSDRFSFQTRGLRSQGMAPETWTPQAGIIGLRPILLQPPLFEAQVDPALGGGGLERAMAIARQQANVAFASHIYCLSQDPHTWIYLRDEITVQFLGEAGLEGRIDRRGELLAPWGLGQEVAVRGLSQTYGYRVTGSTPVNPIKVANGLMTLAEVALAEANVVVCQRPAYQPKDSLYPQQWYLANRGGAELSPQAAIAVEQAWDITRGDRGIVIAIADDSLDLHHPDFQGLGKIVAPRDLAGQDFLPLPDRDSDNHGTAVAGVAAAEENGQGMVGVAPGCAIMPIRTTGFLDDESVEQIFHWAVDQGADVICCSWGAGAVRFPLSLRQQAALTYAARSGRGGKGCAIIFAAGNFNRPLQGTMTERQWPDNLLQGPTPWLNGFGVHPDVITVSACTSLGKKAAYSNWGAEVFVSAPSSNGAPHIWLRQVGLVPTAPPIKGALRGLGVLTCDRTGSAGYDPRDFTQNFGGTSSAAPVVAGVVALMLSANPQLTLMEIKEILRQTADKIVDPDPDPQLGLSYGTYEHQGHSFWFGYGKVNAFRAVRAAQERIAPRGVAPEPLQYLQDQPAAIAPQSTLTRTLSVTEPGTVGSIAVQVTIDHGFLGDVEISLVDPQGRAWLLQPRTLGCQTHLQATYSPANTPMLPALRGQPIQGIWQLQVNDRAAGPGGTLRQWGLVFHRFAGAA